jgi:oligoribonuclease NrnB/cAMP/cGMP phosphodiesterase (DHH superfamily)
LIADVKEWELRMRLREFFSDQNEKEWELRMRLREFFSDQNEKEDVLTDDKKQYNFIKKKKSNWTPPTGRSELVKNDIISGVKQKYRINLNRAEEEALQDLLSDQSIVIRPVSSFDERLKTRFFSLLFSFPCTSVLCVIELSFFDICSFFSRERRMRLREFFFDQNEKEDVLTDDQKQYNFIKKKKSNWTPPTGKSEWLDLYLKLEKI